MFAWACRLSLEGIVSKRIDAPYRAGRSDAWRKIKCARTDTMVVIGFSENSRGRIDGLYVARADDNGDMVYAGKVEQGWFGSAHLAELEERLRPLVTRKAQVAVPKKPKAKRVEPVVLVELAFPNLSAEGRLRHPSFNAFATI